MSITRIIFIAITALLAAAQSLAQPAFDPRTYQTQTIGQPTQILVLGSPHLSGAPDDFDPAVLEPLLQRLTAFRPDAIAIEALPGRSISQMWDYRETYPDVVSQYGRRAMVLAALARSSLSLDMPEAEAQVRSTLETWPTVPAPAERRRLAALFAAAGDPASALVQWWRLAPSERKSDESVSVLLAEQFAQYETPARRNENHLIAARLAVRLGLEQVFPMDDQSDDGGPGFAASLEPYLTSLYAELQADPKGAAFATASEKLTSPEQALATYRMLNAPENVQLDPDFQWLPMLNRPSPDSVGRARVALWEVRNLRMAANIREVSARTPGGRVLVITGSSHKAWLDAYFSMMSDVHVVDVQAVLR